MASVELQRLEPHADASDANIEHAVPTLHPLLRPPARPSSAASSVSNDKAPSLQKPPPAAPTYKRYLEWWPELGAALLSSLLLIAIVIFLAKLDGSKLDDWDLPWQIKPPTILSILVTSCRITLAFFIAEGIGQLKWVFFDQRPHQLSDFEAFDEATRGPWGVTCLIWKVNRRAFMATFGAVMAILVLAMDPFSQQALSYVSQTSNITNSAATIPSTRFYDSGATRTSFNADNSSTSFERRTEPSATFSSVNSNGSSSGQLDLQRSIAMRSSAKDDSWVQKTGRNRLSRRDDSTANGQQGTSNCTDTLMARASYAGLYGSVPAPAYDCASGNCTWPSFTTLGVCSQCNNITSRVKASCNEYDAGERCKCWYELTGAGELPGSVAYPGPDGNEEYQDNDSTKFESLCAADGRGHWPLWFTWASNVWDKSKDILSFTSYRFPKKETFESSHAHIDCTLPMAHVEQCTLFWCAKSFESAAVVNGRISEGRSTNYRLVPFNATNEACPGLRTLEAPQRGSGIVMQGLIREDKACPQSREDLGPHDTFWVNQNDHAKTINLLSPMIDEQKLTVNIISDTETLGRRWDTYDVGNAPALPASYSADSDGSAAKVAKAAKPVSDAATLTALWDNHGGNLSMTMDDIATSMTNLVRSTNGYVNVNGTSTRTDTVIKVSWYWLIYMVAMVGLSLAFFVIAIIFASEKSKVVWKSSSLAVLMHGLEGFERDELNGRSVHDMGKTAKSLWVQLEMDDQGSLRLVRH